MLNSTDCGFESDEQINVGMHNDAGMNPLAS